MYLHILDVSKMIKTARILYVMGIQERRILNREKKFRSKLLYTDLSANESYHSFNFM